MTQNLFSKKKSKKFYAYVVLAKKKKGIAESWGECEKQVKGEEARFKGFFTREEAEEWLKRGGDYAIKVVKKSEPGIYFDAGTGRGEGVDISVTDEKGKNLLHKVIPKKELAEGKHLLGKEVTNNYGELLACKYAIEIAMAENIQKVFGDSKLVIEFWTKWRVKKEVPEKTFQLAHEVSGLREEFEKRGGKIMRISGEDNPADLGFH